MRQTGKAMMMECLEAEVDMCNHLIGGSCTLSQMRVDAITQIASKANEGQVASLIMFIRALRHCADKPAS